MDAQLTTESFGIPEEFDGPSLLLSAWGIMYGDDVTEVALRFAPSATRRVKETYWHPSQCLEDTEDGDCILRVQVAHPREMIYWIRGWGPQVEVLKPQWMREQMAREAGEIARTYAERSDYET